MAALGIVTAWLVAGALAGCGRFAFDDVPTGADPDARLDGDSAACGPGSEPTYVAPPPPDGARWVAPDGNDSATGMSRAAAWATFAFALTQVGAGDTLVIADGTYAEPLDITVSGAPQAPLVVRAETDGGAIIDGGGTVTPCQIRGQPSVAYVELEGIQCRNSVDDVVRIQDAANVTLRRVSAYEASDPNDLFHADRTTDLTIEDCAATGRANIVYRISESTNARVRRSWAHWTQSTTMFHSDFGLFETSDSVLENNVATMVPAGPDDIGIQLSAYATSGSRADRNFIYGNVVRNVGAWGIALTSRISRIEGNKLSNNALLGGSGGIYQRADANLIASRNTLVANAMWAGWSTGPSADAKDADFALAAELTNSIVVGAPVGILVSASAYQNAFTSDYNNVFDVPQPYSGVATAGPADVSVEPAFDVATYGPGAYLLGPTAMPTAANGDPYGARILFQSNDGTPTSERLWPWPMEERIARETGTSITWESGGGLWRTLCGVYE